MMHDPERPVGPRQETSRSQEITDRVNDFIEMHGEESEVRKSHVDAWLRRFDVEDRTDALQELEVGAAFNYDELPEQ